MSTVDGISALRAVLRRMRWDDQGGYPGRRGGKWDLYPSTMDNPRARDVMDCMQSVSGAGLREAVDLLHAHRVLGS